MSSKSNTIAKGGGQATQHLKKVELHVTSKIPDHIGMPDPDEYLIELKNQAETLKIYNKWKEIRAAGDKRLHDMRQKHKARKNAESRESVPLSSSDDDGE